jgi:hypothetical protein
MEGLLTDGEEGAGDEVLTVGSRLEGACRSGAAVEEEPRELLPSKPPELLRPVLRVTPKSLSKRSALSLFVEPIRSGSMGSLGILGSPGPKGLSLCGGRLGTPTTGGEGGGAGGTLPTVPLPLPPPAVPVLGRTGL